VIFLKLNSSKEKSFLIGPQKILIVEDIKKKTFSLADQRSAVCRCKSPDSMPLPGGQYVVWGKLSDASCDFAPDFP